MDVEITYTLFSRNKASQYLGSGGGLRIEGESMNCTMSKSVAFSSNIAELNGGAVFASAGTRLRIIDASFVGNEVAAGSSAALFAVVSLLHS